MFYLDGQIIQQGYQERLKEAEQDRLVRAFLHAQRQAAKCEQPAFRLPHFGRLFGRRRATARAAAKQAARHGRRVF